MYFAASLIHGNVNWKPRSTPAIIPLCKNQSLINILNIFINNGSTDKALSPPPWKIINFAISPLSKTEAVQNPCLARLLFHELYEPLSVGAVNILQMGLSEIIRQHVRLLSLALTLIKYGNFQINAVFSRQSS